MRNAGRGANLTTFLLLVHTIFRMASFLLTCSQLFAHIYPLPSIRMCPLMCCAFAHLFNHKFKSTLKSQFNSIHSTTISRLAYWLHIATHAVRAHNGARQWEFHALTHRSSPCVWLTSNRN